MQTRPDANNQAAPVSGPAASSSAAPPQSPNLLASRMTNTHYITVALPYLNPIERLLFGATSKSYSQLAHDYTQTCSGPYTSRAAFFAANKRAYCLTPMNKKNLDILTDAWNSYTIALTAASNHPAMLYKLVDLSSLTIGSSLLNWFKKDDADLVLAGRQYNPELHNWAVNAAWMLGQFHRRREFTLLSNLTGRNIMRSHAAHEYSALTREVACTMQANYAITHIENQSTNVCITLAPPEETSALMKMKVTDLSPTDATCRQSVNWIAQKRSIYDQAMKIRARLSLLFSFANSTDIFDVDSIDANPVLNRTESDSSDGSLLDIDRDTIVSRSNSHHLESESELEAQISTSDLLAFQAKITEKFHATLAVLNHCDPLTLHYFVSHHNSVTKSSSAGGLPAIPQPNSQIGFFIASCTSAQIATVLKNALTTCCQEQLLKLTQESASIHSAFESGLVL
jgi:hypothetical protein